MSFWSGERLAEELSKGLVTPYSPSQLDCASYRLCVGTQTFVTADKFSNEKKDRRLITILGDAPDHTIRIAPGQFAFLLTFESIRVPSNAMALISMRVKYKFQGLINVSGFHVDPGWDGKLIFSVYNAGPIEVVIERLEPMFLIVFADLDRNSQKTYKGQYQGQDSLRPALVQGMLSQVFSPLMLQRKMEALEASTTWIKTVGYAVAGGIGILIAMLGVLATYSPQVPGLLLATMIENAGYEIKRKPVESKPDSDSEKRVHPISK